MPKTKPTTLLIDQDTIHSSVEGGLWSMRLLAEHESVTNVKLVNGQYEVTINGEKEEDMNLPW